MTTRVHWSKLFDGPLATVTADTRNVIAIEREVIPLVFVPGIMGSRLKRTAGGSGRDADVVWDPDSKLFLARLVATSQEVLRERIIGATFQGDYLSVIGRTRDGAVDAADRALSDAYRGYAGAFERGWAGVFQGSYVPFLKSLEDAEWLEPVGHCFELPVHAFGYNWTQSNMISGRELAAYVRRTVAYYRDAGRDCRHAILLTHSMGGLVTRAAVQALAGSDLVLGVVHGAQPAPGSVNAYWRMKGGMEDFATGLALGNTGPKTTLLLGNMPGGLELLPNKSYRTNPAADADAGTPLWLAYPDPGSPADAEATVRRPVTGNPYDEIYRERERFFRLVDESWLDPARPVGAWERYLDYLYTSEAYHDRLDGYAHPDTVQFYASDVSTQDRIEFRRVANRFYNNWRWTFWRGGYRRGVEPDGRVSVDVGSEAEWLMYLEITDALGDGTVSDGAGRHLQVGGAKRTVRIGDDVEPIDSRRKHQDVYLSEPVRHVARMAIENLCLKRIDAVVGAAGGSAGGSAQ